VSRLGLTQGLKKNQKQLEKRKIPKRSNGGGSKTRWKDYRQKMVIPAKVAKKNSKKKESVGVIVEEIEESGRKVGGGV